MLFFTEKQSNTLWCLKWPRLVGSKIYPNVHLALDRARSVVAQWPYQLSYERSRLMMTANKWQWEQNGGMHRGSTGVMDSRQHVPSAASARPRRRSRQQVKRPRTVRFDLSEDEFAEVGAAAQRAGLAKGAYAAQIVLAAARSGTSPSEFPLREALGEFMRAAGLVRRIGVNLNQAVAKLNATGQRSGELLPYAAESIRRARLLDQAAEEVRKRIRQ